GYSYIEIGDGDELWETSNYYDIIHVHSDTFFLLSKFFREGRLHFIFGNHDIVKNDDTFVKKNLYEFYDDRDKKNIPLFPNVKVHEGLILQHRTLGYKLFLIHGHQVDFLNGRIWRVGRFLVKHLWRPLETLGVNDPTSAAKNYEKKKAVAKKLIEWVKKEKCILIAGHTHKPMFPEIGELPYFNDGSCVHPNSITAIEISGGDILLVKWKIKTRDDGTLFIGREVLAGPRKLKDYY
ncbi:MAG: metallophosphoesterase family protein, partial [Bacillota bacterium]|nr:metallophosphoesterase family protein [Bacillota bacterium]